MKVLLVGPKHKFGGVTRYVKDLLAHSSNYILFDTARPEKQKIRPGTGYVEAFNTDISRVVKGIFVTLRNFVKFPFVLVNSSAETVHICGVSYFPFWENAYYMMISRFLEKKVTLHYLGAFDQFYEPAGKAQKYLIRSVLRIPDKIIFLSKKVKKLVEIFIPSDRLCVLPSSVDTSKFDVPGREYPVSEGEFRVLFVGGLDPFRKGIYDLLDAASVAVAEFPNLKLVLTGGKSFEAIESRWKGDKLDNLIEYRGWIDEDELPGLYASCDILTLPSYNEGLPYVIIEALSSGLPIIASNAGGMPEVVTDGENGYIIEPGEVSDLADRLCRLAGNPELMKRMSNSNRRKAVESYSLEYVTSELQGIFSALAPDCQ